MQNKRMTVGERVMLAAMVSFVLLIAILIIYAGELLRGLFFLAWLMIPIMLFITEHDNIDMEKKEITIGGKKAVAYKITESVTMDDLRGEPFNRLHSVQRENDGVRVFTLSAKEVFVRNGEWLVSLGNDDFDVMDGI